MNCPNCTSNRISTNKIALPTESIMRGAGIARARHPAVAVGLLAGLGLGQAINTLRADWRCDHCDHRFS